MSAGSLLLSMVRASLEGGVLLLLLWFACRAWPRMPATARTALWWLGALRLIAGLFPTPRIPLSSAPTAKTLSALAATPVGEQVTSAVDLARATPAMLGSSTGASPIGWLVIGLTVVWLAGIVVAFAIMMRRLLALQRQWRAATPVTDPRVIALRNDWAIVLGRERVPEVRTAPDVAVPVTVGVWRMGVLLPPGCERLSDDTLRLVFAHEMSHVRRRDPLLAWIPALAQLVFWFHPLARLAAREYLAAREESCDVEALRVTGSSPGDYGALLVEFGVGRIAALPGSASCGAVNARDLKRRLEMLTRSWRIPRAQRIAGVLTVFLFLVLAYAPVRLVVADEEGKPVWYGKDGSSHHHTKTPFSYLLFKKGDVGSRGSVDMADLENIKKFKDPERRNTENITYFRINEDAWISRDPELFAEVTAALDPVDRLEAARRPTELQRNELDHQQQRFDQRIEDLERRGEALRQRKASLEDARESGKSERELAAMQADIEDDEDSLIAERRELSHMHQGWSERYRALEVSDKARFAEMDRVHQQVMLEVKRIAKRAIADGRAQPLED